jgi:trimethylamine--corrinoid protein Co-methyltransferase
MSKGPNPGEIAEAGRSPVTAQVQSKRRGRSAMRSFRASHTAHEPTVVHGGLPGGQYRPLSDSDLGRIHETALKILEHYGFADATESMRETLLGNGAFENESGRICFPRALIEDTLAKACKGFEIVGLDGKRAIDLSDNKVNFGGSSYTANILDMETGDYRKPTVADLYDLVRLEDTLDHLHYVRIPVIAQDIEAEVYDVNSAYVMAAATGKPFSMNISFEQYVDPVLALFDMVAGGEGRFKRRPFCLPIMVHVVPPLKFAADSCRVIERLARMGLPMIIYSAGMSGATSPAALAGMLAQSVAECLAGLAWVNMLSPGLPVVFGLAPLSADLRSGACTMGAAEQALMEAASAQISNFYGLPGGQLSGATDAKVSDVQSGWERGYCAATIALAGANHIGIAAGGHASNMGMSAESLVIDNDMIGNVLRILRGIEVSEDSLSFEAIGDVIRGEGHYLSHPQTMKLMSSEYYYPEFADRDSIKDWEEKGRPDIRERARKKAREILRTHYPAYIDPAVDEAIRQRFDIRLPRDYMRSQASG